MDVPLSDQSQWRIGTPLRLVVAAFLFLMMGALSYLAVNELGANGQRVPSGLLGPAPVPVGTDPFLVGGQGVSLAQAQSLTGFAVPTPNAALASPQGLSRVWFAKWKNDDGTTAREVVLDYVATSVRIYIEPAGPGFGSDPHAAYLREAASDGVPSSSVQTVNGASALVVGADNGQPGSLDTVRNGVEIAITGPLSADQLISVANALP